MCRLTASVVVLLALLATACASESPAPPTPDIEATVTAMVRALPTQPPPPTLAALPTYTPGPTATAYPTYTPAPSATPYPTLEPLPTHTPYPTQTPLPTHTPQPTLEPLPTHTPYPTPTARPAPAPIVRTVTERDNWKVDSLGMYTVIGDSPGRGTWVLGTVCFDDGDLGVWLWHALGRVFSASRSGDESLLAEFDGDSQEQTWYYFPANTDSDDFLSAKWPRNVIGKLIDSKKVVFTIPTASAPYVVTFDIAGLDRHIKEPDDLCE